jgi:exopolysaccharide biosynthesis protein
MYNDGSMETIPNSQFNMNEIKNKAPYQVWGFGPILLTNGQPATKFNSPDTIGGANPRTAIGYYEPGHYCFVSVDGRSTASKGYKLADLANLFYNLGCKEAFNLDGGGSSAMGFMGKIISNPCSDYRKTYDMIYITDKDN